MAGTAPTVYSWDYADWDTQSTDAEKLARLGQHIEEVARVAGDFQNAGGNRMRMSDSYLNLLKDARNQLLDSAPDESTLQATALQSHFGVRRFVRGSGP